MAYSAAAILALASQCAPNVAPQTVAAIVQTESHGRPFALNVNGGSQPPAQNNAASAAATAQRYIAAGYSVDLGLGQINSRNMRWLGLTWDTVFDPCTNVAALGRVITQNYNSAIPGRDPQSALRVALSLYNTGSSSRGFRNGYVAKVVGNAGFADPVTVQEPMMPQRPLDARVQLISENLAPSMMPTAGSIAPPAWSLFERAAHARQTANRSETRESISVWRD
ncbi:MAG: lytic transglycosylase domain-containing protein [Usitatibacteraceae bacterium]